MFLPLHTVSRQFARMAANLPHLADIERLSPRVIRILGGNPGKFTLQGTNTFLVGTGKSRILIDTAQGIPTWKNRLASVLQSEKCTIGKTLLTHWHLDHVLGVQDLRDLVPDCPIHKCRLAVQPQGWGGGYEAFPETDAEPITDGQIFKVEGATLRALHTPGHTKDHMVFVLEEEGNALFAGDNVLGHGTAVFEDLESYLRSLSIMKEACGRQSRLYPSHGQTVEKGCSLIEEYVTHRRTREDEIRTALQTLGDWSTSMQVVKVVYKDYPEALHEPAEGGVKLVLNKLLGEGKARREGDKWRLTINSSL